MSSPLNQQEKTEQKSVRPRQVDVEMTEDQPETQTFTPVPIPELSVVGQPTPTETGAQPKVLFKKLPARKFRSTTARNWSDDEDIGLDEKLAARKTVPPKPRTQTKPKKSVLLQVLESNFPYFEDVFGAVTTIPCFHDVETEEDVAAVLFYLFSTPNAVPRPREQVRPLAALVGALRAKGISWASLAQLMEADRLIEYVSDDGGPTLIRCIGIYGCPALAHYPRVDIIELDAPGTVKIGQAYFTQDRVNADGSLAGCHLLKQWNGHVQSLKMVSLLNSGSIKEKKVWLYEYGPQRALKTVCQDIGTGNEILWEARRLGVLSRSYQRGKQWTVTVWVEGQHGPIAVKVTFKGANLIHIT